MGKTEPARKMAQPCRRCPPATSVCRHRRRGAPSRSSRGGDEDTPLDSLFTLWSVYNLFHCSTQCPSQQNLTCRCEILLSSLTICFGRSNSTQKKQMICEYFCFSYNLFRNRITTDHRHCRFSGHVCLISPHWTRLDFSVYKPSCQLLRNL
uniref:Uncharacterized protein n=1 Tax=Aegilops tauschii subsp. strangulata TaxID=200361 RepID=A0A453ELZ0_AEGTS